MKKMAGIVIKKLALSKCHACEWETLQLNFSARHTTCGAENESWNALKINNPAY